MWFNPLRNGARLSKIDAQKVRKKLMQGYGDATKALVPTEDELYLSSNFIVIQ